VLLTLADILKLPQATEMLNVVRRFRHSFKYDGHQQVTAQTAKDARFWATPSLKWNAYGLGSAGILSPFRPQLFSLLADGQVTWTYSGYSFGRR
jgi:YD repeat-containing protein